ncbi:MAG TPA: hypothetical protein VN638_01510 [Nitrospiraceae bacterium]|nr:hypothetical protein [Nitrospiraceae bacterium]
MSGEIFSGEAAVELGHAVSWIDAGTVYEDLIALFESQEPPDVVICMDPWAAQLCKRPEVDRSQCRWIFVTDSQQMRTSAHSRYWDQVEAWLAELPFYATFCLGVVGSERTTALDPESQTSHPKPAVISRTYLEKPGAWRWKRISEPQPLEMPGTGIITLLLQHSGSLSHLRIFMDSWARQDFSKSRMRLLLLARAWSQDLSDYLRWLSLVHTDLDIVRIDQSQESWGEQLDGALATLLGSTLVMTGDHALLPETFASTVRGCSGSKTGTVILGVPMSLEVSAQIILGNMDHIRHQDSLLRAFAGASRHQPIEIARVFPPLLWGAEAKAISQQLLSLSEDKEAFEPVRQDQPWHLLQLAELP